MRRGATEAAPAASLWIPAVIGDYAKPGHPASGPLWRGAMGVHRRASAWLASRTDDVVTVSR